MLSRSIKLERNGIPTIRLARVLGMKEKKRLRFFLMETDSNNGVIPICKSNKDFFHTPPSPHPPPL